MVVFHQKPIAHLRTPWRASTASFRASTDGAMRSDGRSPSPRARTACTGGGRRRAHDHTGALGGVSSGNGDCRPLYPRYK